MASPQHRITVQSFLDDVIEPVVRSFEERIEALGQSGQTIDAFEQADLEEVLRETKLAFGLSIQSLWERQLRRYVSGCAEEIRPGEDLAKRAMAPQWDHVLQLFQELRGIALGAFPSSPRLEILHLLGNACRHGDGRSAIELWKRCPDLWPARPATPFDDPSQDPQPPSVSTMDLPVERLREFVAAIVAFWDDAAYIYLESIERKHPTVAAKPVRLRAERSWHPAAGPSS